METSLIDKKVLDSLEAINISHERYLVDNSAVIDRDDETRGYANPVRTNYASIQRLILLEPHDTREFRDFDPELWFLQRHVIDITCAYVTRLFLFTFAINITWMPSFFFGGSLKGRFEHLKIQQDVLSYNKHILVGLLQDWEDQVFLNLDYIKNETMENRASDYGRNLSWIVTDFTELYKKAVKSSGLDEALAEKFVKLIQICVGHLNYEFQNITMVEGPQLYSTCCMKCSKAALSSI